MVDVGGVIDVVMEGSHLVCASNRAGCVYCATLRNCGQGASFFMQFIYFI